MAILNVLLMFLLMLLQFGKLKELRLMLEESEPDIQITVKKLAMFSLMEIFKDIIPGYRIRVATEQEKTQPVGLDCVFYC